MNMARKIYGWLRTVGCSALTLALVVALGGNAARANEELRKELEVVAKSLSSALKSMNESTVAVGAFTGPETLPTSAGPTFTKLLQEELAKQDLTVKRPSRYSITGKYLDVIDARDGKLGAHIMGELVDKNGTVITTFDRGVKGAATLSALFGLTAELPVNKPDDVRDEVLKASIDNPSVTINEAKVSASASSPYIVELLVKGPGGFQPRPAIAEDGFAFCKIARDEIYAVRIHNNSPFDASVILSIDGLSVFAFSDHKNYTHYIVPARKTVDILGWHRTNQVSDSFLVTSYGDSEVAKALPNSATVGTVTAIFAAAWSGNNVPPDEPRTKGAVPEATKRGPPVGQTFTEVERFVGATRATVSIRYSRDEPINLPPPEGN